MTSEHVFAVILAGGSGTRFWPASRRARAKQFLAIAGPEPLLTETYRRIAPWVPPERALVVTGRDQVEATREALPELPAENILAEPVARNTAASVALGARVVEERDDDAVQIVLPADHVIRPAEAFRATLEEAVAAARADDVLITFGIRPSFPATGFGYIEADDSSPGGPARDVRRFVEKPSLERAREFLDSGRFFWNSGLFVWHTRAIRAAINEHFPEAREALDAWRGGASLDEVFPRIPARSVDVAILEKARNVRMFPIDYFWSDVGSWSALGEVLEADAAGNIRAGDAEITTLDARDCIAYAEDGELIALIGVSDLIVARSGKATLICHRDRAQDVKGLVDRLREHDGESELL